MSAPGPSASFGTVVDWLEGRLDADGSAAVERLVRGGDTDALDTIEWWRRFHAAASLPTEPVPDSLAVRLRSMSAATQGAAGAASPSWLDRFTGMVRASLSFDSLHSPGLAMARSSSDATRQLAFSGPGIDVSIDMAEPSGDQLTATAQLLPVDVDADAADVMVQIWARRGLVAERRSDALGRVELGVLPTDVVIVEVDRAATWPAIQVELDLRRSG
ncbi:MAG: hypothetical protein M3419_01715 [Actinomycetota bacterium]|nr:hypothetical protein [Actinomycetota bacterium]